MTNLEKSIELARKHEGLFGMRNREECCVAACQEMAEYKDKKIICYLKHFIELSNEGNLLKLQISIESVIKEFES